MTWIATILTARPALFPGTLQAGIFNRALEREVWKLDLRDIRDYALDRHRSVDGTPAGGGPGMIMRADIGARALDAVPDDLRPRLVFTPRGRRIQQSDISSWASGPGIIALCCRFEGIDQRLITARDLEEVSLGDFILAGGEVAALAVTEACLRLLPGILGSQKSVIEESFSDGLLEYPQYTAPRDFEGHIIPPVLLSGDHGSVASWRQTHARADTKKRRPDLWQTYLAERQ